MPEEPPSRCGSGMPAAMSCRIDIHISAGNWDLEDDPPATVVSRAALAALSMGCDGAFDRFGGPSELSVTLSDDRTVAGLNRQYRGKEGPTNVLSFPAFGRDELMRLLSAAPTDNTDGPPLMLGDVILADGVLKAEAAAQGKPVAHHLGHLVVHSVLHCLGYDHETAVEADEMEALERAVLATLDIPDPYFDDGRTATETGHG